MGVLVELEAGAPGKQGSGDQGPDPGVVPGKQVCPSGLESLKQGLRWGRVRVTPMTNSCRLQKGTNGQTSLWLTKLQAWSILDLAKVEPSEPGPQASELYRVRQRSPAPGRTEGRTVEGVSSSYPVTSSHPCQV